MFWHRLPFITCNDEHFACLKPTNLFIWLLRHSSTLTTHHIIGMATTIQSTSVLPSGKAAVLAKNDSDVVIVAAVRSAMTKVLLETPSSRFSS